MYKTLALIIFTSCIFTCVAEQRRSVSKQERSKINNSPITRIKFPPGSKETTIRDNWGQYGKQYVFSARRGQKVELNIGPDGNNAEFQISYTAKGSGPFDSAGSLFAGSRRRWSGVIPETNSYEIYVMGDDKIDYRRDRRAKSYELTIRIE